MIYHFYWKKIKVGKVENFVANFFEQKVYVVYIRTLKQALNHGFV